MKNHYDFFSLYSDNVVTVTGEVTGSTVYLHCNLLVKFTKSILKHLFLIFEALKDKLLNLGYKIAAVCAVCNDKLFKFLSLFGFKPEAITADQQYLVLGV